jgi:predicted TIM-barrel fold metal-dependent hydrolase
VRPPEHRAEPEPGIEPEAVIEPDLAIVDPHHHLWSRPGDVYMIPDLVEDLSTGHRVVATVYVEASSFYRDAGPPERRSVGETATVAALASGSPVAGIVANVDLRHEGIDDLLDEHLAAAGGLLRGIRHRLAWDPHPGIRAGRETTPGLLADRRFRRGLRALAARGLVFDAWLFFGQLPELVDVAREIPEVTIVLDHLGVAPIGTAPYPFDDPHHLARWRTNLARVATCPNVTVKLGGIGMVRYGAWSPGGGSPTSDELLGRWRDPLHHAVDAFGPSRAMFESNFPVDKDGCSYRVLWNAFKKASAGYDAAERAALFGRTAVAIYRLGDQWLGAPGEPV